ncbi:hypothetical protein PAECIP111892_02859 [Paenibacillus auburnensis]|uniref:Post-SET domain-containing protein n=1 Tax=Paenibacillus auburnensis TaxID=2905649 RepID=A0ABM9C8W4_9BACL|nr:hypothetical protein [Paenibacillus auburnensis]CAH1207358.1 hypothetical protein PAECIP111892_02859 [Paenibacillus auburnensis]
MICKLLNGHNFDKLRVEVNVDVSKKYINVSKHKRILIPVIIETINLYVNEVRLNEDDEIFVVTEFFKSLAQQGEFPMFTCSCGNFGCGGFYIKVNYKNQCVLWETEQATYGKFLFSRNNIRLVALELIKELAEFNGLRKENGLKPFHDIDSYIANLDIFLNPNRQSD